MKKRLTLTTKTLLLALCMLVMGNYLQAQVTVGDGAAPQDFSVLEVSTENLKGGLRMPRLNNQEIKALEAALIKSPAQSQGLMIYNLNTNCIQTWTGTLTKWLVYCGLNEEALTGIRIQTVQNVLWWNGDDSPGQETQTRLEVVYSPSSTTERGVEWRVVGAPDIISISGYGEVKALKDGKVQVFAVSTVDNSIQSNTLEITVRTKLFGLVADAPVKQLWTNGTGSANEEKSVQATLEYKTSASRSYKDVAWKSSNTAVATVSATGLITAVGNGSAYIYAESTDQPGTTSNNISITVGTKLRGFKFSKAATALQLGAIATDVITVSLDPLNSTDYTDFDAVVCSDNNIAACTKNSNQVTITAKAAGSCNLKVSKQCSDRLVQSATYPITVALPVGAIGTLDCGSNTIYVINGQAVPSNTFTVTYSGKTGDIIVLANNQALGSAVNGLTVVADGAQTLGLGATGSVRVKVVGTCTATTGFTLSYTVGGASCTIGVAATACATITSVNSGGKLIQTVNPNTSVTVGAVTPVWSTGTYTAAYQWYKGTTNSTTGGVLISGATSSTYTFTTSTDFNYYYCIVRNTACGSSTMTSAVYGAGACGARTTSGTWLRFMCHNLGADTNLDPFTYVVGNADGSGGTLGWLYQWGRREDGHQKRNSLVVNGQTSSDAPNNANYYVGQSNWTTSPTANLWGPGSTKGVNDPCPSGWRLPSAKEWDSIHSANGAPNVWVWTGNGYKIGSSLFLPCANYRILNGALGAYPGLQGSYWSSNEVGYLSGARSLEFSDVFMGNGYVEHTPILSTKNRGESVRCVAE